MLGEFKMAKFYGAIGYGLMTETNPGVWNEDVSEYFYYGDVIKNARQLQTIDQINDKIVLSNQISIISDPFANENFQNILYVLFMGVKWKVTNVEVQYPRLILTLGGVYNG